MNYLNQIRTWLRKEIEKAEKKIDRGEPFRYWEARKEAFEEVLEKIANLGVLL